MPFLILLATIQPKGMEGGREWWQMYPVTGQFIEILICGILLLEENKKYVFFPYSNKPLCSASGILGFKGYWVGSGFRSRSQSYEAAQRQAALSRSFPRDKTAWVVLLLGTEGKVRSWGEPSWDWVGGWREGRVPSCASDCEWPGSVPTPSQRRAPRGRRWQASWWICMWLGDKGEQERVKNGS